MALKEGTVFGLLTVIGEAPSDKHDNRRSIVECQCGTVKVVRDANMKYGKTKSCGCKAKNKNKIYDVNRFFGHLTENDKNNEEWVRYNRKYEVSNCGRVRNNEGHILNPQLVSNKKHKGYLQFNLHGSGFKYAHRLVAEAFMDDFNSSLQCHHKNHDTFDNRLCNIVQVSSKEHTSIHRSKAVVAYDFDHNKVFEFERASDAKQYGFTPSAISRSCNGLLKTYKGLIWVFRD